MIKENKSNSHIAIDLTSEQIKCKPLIKDPFPLTLTQVQASDADLVNTK